MDDSKFWNEPNLSPTKVKRQHYVPQVLLRAFAVNGKVRVVDLDSESKEYKTSTANIAVEKHFYNVDLSDIQVSTEDWLAELEGNAAPVIAKLVQDLDSITSLSIEEELYMARFITALRFRTPSFRDWNDNMIKSILQKIKDMAKEQVYHQHSKSKADTIWGEMKDKPDHWWFNEPEPQQPATTTAFMLGEVKGFSNLIRAAPWRIGTAPESIQLYTSDNPVAGYLNPVRPWWEGAAFASFTYYMPLSPKILLKIERMPDRKDGEDLRPQGERRRCDFSSWEISFARHIITNDARKYLYGEGSIVTRECASSCLERIGRAKLEFAMYYLGFDPRPPKVG